jgi:hypothetical protein
VHGQPDRRDGGRVRSRCNAFREPRTRYAPAEREQGGITRCARRPRRLHDVPAATDGAAVAGRNQLTRERADGHHAHPPRAPQPLRAGRSGRYEGARPARPPGLGCARHDAGAREELRNAYAPRTAQPLRAPHRAAVARPPRADGARAHGQPVRRDWRRARDRAGSAALPMLHCESALACALAPHRGPPFSCGSPPLKLRRF